ncbi:AraC family transcriptional regulator [Sphingobacterium sp.]|uniref:AraC family transcriptional regulator n=1 Tax=Sphingobacterium sp. TaxID=341027 RepID=UPI0028AF6154|nr:AraC family transcriptional regulator [Sphingobacterium sp.]
MKRDDQTVPSVLQKLADILGAEVKNRKLEIPTKFGSGYCIGFVFNEHIRMLISNYELNQNIEVENPELDETKKLIFFKFQNIFPKLETVLPRERASGIPSVLIATSRINTDEIIAIHSNTSTINIEVDTAYLSKLLTGTSQSQILKRLIQNTQPYLFEQLIYPTLQRVVDEIMTDPISDTFELLLKRIKAEELICRLLMELEKRDEKHIYAINNYDISILYKIRDQILEHLHIPPVISELSIAFGMSPTKLKRLFKQVFGDSIFSYYQRFRMNEAAFLLKEGPYSVSEVGYKLGFTNLSHFSKLFKEHFGMNPKMYTMM